MCKDLRCAGELAHAPKLCRERHGAVAKNSLSDAESGFQAKGPSGTIDRTRKKEHTGSHAQDHTAPRLNERRPPGRSLCHAGLPSGKVQHPVFSSRHLDHRRVLHRRPGSVCPRRQHSRPGGALGCVELGWQLRPVRVAHSRSLTRLRTQFLPGPSRDENERDGAPP